MSANFIDIVQNSVVDTWFKQKTKTEIMAVISLLSDNIQNFERLYDTKPKQNSENPNLLYWQINYQSIAYMFICHKETKNTVYYVQYTKSPEEFKNDFAFGTYIVKFLEFLLKQKIARNLS